MAYHVLSSPATRAQQDHFILVWFGGIVVASIVLGLQLAVLATTKSILKYDEAEKFETLWKLIRGMRGVHAAQTPEELDEIICFVAKELAVDIKSSSAFDPGKPEEDPQKENRMEYKKAIIVAAHLGLMGSDRIQSLYPRDSEEHLAFVGELLYKRVIGTATKR